MWTILFLGVVVLAIIRPQLKNGAREHPPLSKGEIGEHAVQRELDSTLAWLCPDDHYIHPTALVLRHAPYSSFPTAEVDHMLITPFGIFVVETKNWLGSIGPGPLLGQLTRVSPNGEISARRCPVAQNRMKVEYVQRLVTPVWSVESLCVFADVHSHLDRHLPQNIIRIDDLRQYLREKDRKHRESGAPKILVDVAKIAILPFCDSTTEALATHRKLVANNN
jgi:hypothetical protein